MLFLSLNLANFWQIFITVQDQEFQELSRSINTRARMTTQKPAAVTPSKSSYNPKVNTALEKNLGFDSVDVPPGSKGVYSPAIGMGGAAEAGTRLPSNDDSTGQDLSAADEHKHHGIKLYNPMCLTICFIIVLLAVIALVCAILVL